MEPTAYQKAAHEFIKEGARPDTFFRDSLISPTLQRVAAGVTETLPAFVEMDDPRSTYNFLLVLLEQAYWKGYKAGQRSTTLNWVVADDSRT